MENKLSPIEEIEFIKNIINESRSSIIYKKSSIVWGIMTILALIITYLGIKTNSNYLILPAWGVVIILGWIYTFYENRKYFKQTMAVTFVDRITAKVWIGFGIATTIIGVLALVFKTINGFYISPMICLLSGMGFFITGELHKKYWFRNLSFGWWAGAAIMFLFPHISNLLLMAGIILLFQVFPGLLIKYKKL